MRQRIVYRLLLALAALGAVAAMGRSARAAGGPKDDVALKVEYGWGGKVRAGRWMPITVYAADAARTREAVLDVYAPQGGSYGMRVRQVFVLGPAESALQVYVPMRSYGSDPPMVTILDAATDKTLARYPEDPDTFSFYNQFADTNHKFVGVSGVRSSLMNLDEMIAGEQAYFAYMPPNLLPTTPMGYDGLDLLILNRPDLIRLAPERQQAILEWVHAGGNLVLWPGDDPAPENAPLVAALPCTIGGVQDYPLDPRDRELMDTRQRFTALHGRVLTARPGAEELRPFPNSGLRAYRVRWGMGHIVVARCDTALFRFGNPQDQKTVWGPLVQGMGVLSTETAGEAVSSSGYNVDPDASRQDFAVQQAQDYLGDIPGAGQFGFSYLATVLIGMMIVVGPVDWFVLKRLGRQPWTWVTTTGWIVLVTLAAMFIGHWFKSGKLHYRSVELVDQVGNETVGSTGITCIYSPRTTDYHLDAPHTAASPAPADGSDASAAPPPTTGEPAPPAGWWQPASGEQYGSRSAMQHDIDFHQTDTGNAPGREAGGRERPMLINIWNMRFLRSDTTTPGAPMIAASFTIKKVEGASVAQSSSSSSNASNDDAATLRIVGSITNLTDQALLNIRIRTEHGFAVASASIQPKVLSGNENYVPSQTYTSSTTGAMNAKTAGNVVWPPLIDRLAPHATISVDALLRGGSGKLPPLRQASLYSYGRYGGETQPVDASMLWLPVGNLAGRRAHEADLMVMEDDATCVYAEVENPTPPASLREAGAIDQHYKLIRAIFPATRPSQP